MKPKPKIPSPAKVATDLLKGDPGAASAVLSAALGQPIRIARTLDTAFLHQPVYPDLVIRHENECYVFGFFAEGDNRKLANEMMLFQMSASLALDDLEGFPHTLAVWVGVGLVDFELRIDVPNLKYTCPIVDIREEFAASASTKLLPIQREVIEKLKAAHELHGGLINRLLELPPAERQREFVAIATSFGYDAPAVRFVP